MEKVQGVGGVFFKARDPGVLSAWYRDHLGVPVAFEHGAMFEAEAGAMTVWTVFADESKYFAPSTKPFMINFRVSDLDKMLAQLRALGDAVDDKVEDSEYGRFAWVMDPEGNRIELWQPPKDG